MRNRDPFAKALATLRQRAISGDFGADRPIVILEEARAIRLSTTPVREALAWLGGEGVVERSVAGGYRGLRHEPSLIAGRYRLRLHCLLQAMELVHPDAPAWIHIAQSQGAAVLDWIARSSGDVVLIDVHERVQAQLGPLEPAEIKVFPDRASALQRIAEAALRRHVADLQEQLKDYHEERIAAAPVLAAELARCA